VNRKMNQSSEVLISPATLLTRPCSESDLVPFPSVIFPKRPASFPDSEHYIIFLLPRHAFMSGSLCIFPDDSEMLLCQMLQGLGVEGILYDAFQWTIHMGLE
jgi:hypothetical protein